METLVADRMSHESTPEMIEADLTDLWREAARETPIARALMANLIVFREGTEMPADLRALLDDVVRRHPARVIVLQHAPTQATEPSKGRLTSASVGIVTFGPPHARYGIEEIAVRSACAEISLPSIVRRFARGDVPTSIWWTEDLSRIGPIRSLTRMARQLVYDSRDWRDVGAGARALSPLLDDENRLQLADANWRRISALRYAIVHAARTMAAGADLVRSVEVRHEPGATALAWLLVGWLRSRLGQRASRVAAPVEDARSGDAILTVILDEVTATMTAARIRVESTRNHAPFQIAARQESEADALLAELQTLTADQCLHDTIVELARET